MESHGRVKRSHQLEEPVCACAGESDRLRRCSHQVDPEASVDARYHAPPSGDTIGLVFNAQVCGQDSASRRQRLLEERRDIEAHRVGWGNFLQKNKKYEQPVKLHKADIGPIHTGDPCKKGAKDDVNKVEWDGAYCYFRPETKVESSQGDSGGPYVAQGKQFGIVSSQVGDSKVVVKVGYYRKWIDAVIANFDASSRVVKSPPSDSIFMKVDWNPPPKKDFKSQSDLDKWGVLDKCDCDLEAAGSTPIPPDPDCKVLRRNHMSVCSKKDHFCNDAGKCEQVDTNKWTCAPSSFGEMQYCEIYCGSIADPDCAFVDLGMPETDFTACKPELYKRDKNTKLCAQVPKRQCCQAKHTMTSNACAWQLDDGTAQCADLSKHQWAKAVNMASKFSSVAINCCDPSTAVGDKGHKCTC